MDFKPKTEPLPQTSGDVGNEEKLRNMSIPDLISKLRIATRTKQFDEVEKVLVARENELKGEIVKLKELLDCERLDRMKIEEDLKKCEAECEKGKRAEELYEKLLEAVKENGLQDDGDRTVDELRTKNRELEGELEMWKKKFEELDERLSSLENETQMLMMKEGNNEEDCGAELGVALEAEEKIETLRGGEFGNNNADSPILHRNGDTCAGIGQSTSNPYKDASASGRLGLGPIIEIDSDGDDNVCTPKKTLVRKEETSRFVTDNGHPSSSVAAAQRKSIPSVAGDIIGMLKRKFGSRDSPYQFQKYLSNGVDSDVSSSSSSDSSDAEAEQTLKRRSGHTIDKGRKA